MFKNKSIIHLIACANLLSTSYTFTHETVQDTTLVDHIAQKYTVSTFGPEKTPSIDNTKPNGVRETLKKEFAAKELILTEHEIYKIGFNFALRNKTFNSTIIDQSSIDKLEILGGGENKTLSLVKNIINGYTNTVIGEAFTTLTLCHPTINTKILHNRQQIISIFATHEQLREKIDSSLKTIHHTEKKSLIFWQEKPIVNEKTLALLRFGRINNYIELNTEPFALESFNKELWILNELGWIIGLARSRAFVKNHYPDAFIIANSVIAGYLGLSALSQYFIGNILIKNEIAVCNHLQDILIATADHIAALKNISSAINKHKSLVNNIPSFKPLADFNDTTKHSAKLNKLLNILDTKTFTGEPSILSYTGRVLAAYELMQQVKDELAPVFAAAGELDMYVALAKLYNDREGKVARYCMVNFIANSTTPIIDAKNFWNPFINPDMVVVNDAKFDATQPNSILTGPNTGGKSTVIKAIMVNALMAQTFGIAPSSSLTITPFAKLNCFMNISDDIATGASLFKSEVMRAKKLLDMVQTLQPNEFSFVIIDEVFTGTSPVEGEAAALRFAKLLGTYTNNISIIATHYPKMVDLEVETHGIYRNNHVEILRNEDESLNRTFKLKSGPSFFNVAFDILEEEGLFV